jgi:hypothetical protein
VDAVISTGDDLVRRGQELEYFTIGYNRADGNEGAVTCEFLAGHRRITPELCTPPEAAPPR